MNGRVCMVVLVACVATVGACEQISFKGGPAEPSDQVAAEWPFVPRVMRIHPFTSISQAAPEEPAVLEARVELLDRLGDVTKGVGQFRFELYTVVPRATVNSTSQKQLFMWTAPMVTLDENRQHYDPITRTYAFKLKMERPPAAGQRLKLLAHFTDPQGQRLADEITLTMSGPPVEAPDS